MSRNKLEGKFAGKRSGIFYRTKEHFYKLPSWCAVESEVWRLVDEWWQEKYKWNKYE